MTSFAPYGYHFASIAPRREALGLSVGGGFNEAARLRFSGLLNSESPAAKGPESEENLEAGKWLH